MPKRYQDEIEEILRRAGEEVPSSSAPEPERHVEDRPPEPRSPRGGVREPTPVFRPVPRRLTITSGKLMLAGMITLLIGIKVGPLVWIGLALLAAAYLMDFLSPRSAPYDKRWRGRAMDDEPEPHWDEYRRRRKK